MLPSAIRERVLAELEKLGKEEQYRVLEFARALSGAKSGAAPGHRLLELSGTLDPDQADQISAAVQEGCERMDVGEWTRPRLNW